MNTPPNPEEEQAETQRLLNAIKEQYRFNTEGELHTLLGGLADEKSKGVTYWDYIEVDTLLSLQKTKTDYPDEVIFIAYHQICELYFKLILQELQKLVVGCEIGTPSSSDLNVWKTVLSRSIRYMDKLVGSFDIMRDGLDEQEFLSFRKALLPASGFQTYQFRLMELMLTPYTNLIQGERKVEFASLDPETEFSKCFELIYWRFGAVDAGTKKATKVLENFNNKYDALFMAQIQQIRENSIWAQYCRWSDSEIKDELGRLMLRLDEAVVKWKMAHLKAVGGYLRKSPHGTGGTDWRHYLPMMKQKINYFPDLWLDVDEDLKRLDKEVEAVMRPIR